MKKAMLGSVSIVLFIVAMSILIFKVLTIMNPPLIQIPQVDKTFEFCKLVVQSKETYGRYEDVLAGCFEVFSGVKIEVK